MSAAGPPAGIALPLSPRAGAGSNPVSAAQRAGTQHTASLSLSPPHRMEHGAEPHIPASAMEQSRQHQQGNPRHVLLQALSGLLEPGPSVLTTVISIQSQGELLG